MLKHAWVFYLASKFSIGLQSFSRQFQLRFAGLENSSCYFHGLCDKGPLDRREESWLDPMAAGKTPQLHLFLDTGESARAKAAGCPASFPVPESRVCVSLCFHVAICAVYFWSRELLDTFLCFSAPHLFLELPPALAASGEAVLHGRVAVKPGITCIFRVRVIQSWCWVLLWAITSYFSVAGSG